MKTSVSSFCNVNALVFLCCFLVVNSSVTHGQTREAGSLYEPESQIESSFQVLKFRYCPSGEMRPGRMPVNGVQSVDPTIQKIREFYITETEITIAQFRTALGEESTDSMKKLAKSQQANLPQLEGLLDTGTDLPIFFVSLEDTVRYCEHLQEESRDLERRSGKSSIEEKQFRLPTHLEWQYAARAVENIEGQKTKPHFCRWLSREELSPASRNKCNEVWTSLGGTGEFPGDQESYLKIAEATGGEQKKVEEVFRECFVNALREPPRNAAGIGTISQVANTQPNTWNISDVHGNVSEWVLSVGLDRIDEVWKGMASKLQTTGSLAGQGGVFLAGGSFNDSFTQSNSVLRFTIWGGPKLSESHAPAPFEYSPSLIEEYYPGFRVVMRRGIRPDWLFVIRSDYYRDIQDGNAATESLATSRKILTELTESGHRGHSVIHFYESLIQKQEGNIAESRAHFEEFKKANSKSSASSSGKSILEQIANKNKGIEETTSPDSIDENEEYWNIYQQLVF